MYISEQVYINYLQGFSDIGWKVVYVKIRPFGEMPAISFVIMWSRCECFGTRKLFRYTYIFFFGDI
jgi:hypothetical protein